jgi:hypothetical protein
MKHKPLALCVAACSAVLVLQAEAQQTARGGMPGDYAGVYLSSLFGEDVSFTATAETVVRQGHDTIRMLVSYVVRGGRIRTEMDMADIEGGRMTPEGLQQMRRVGVDRIIYIYNQDASTVDMVCPGMNGYIRMAGQESTGKGPAINIQDTPIGEETVEGHPCDVHELVWAQTIGPQRQGKVWRARDMDAFPLQFEFREGDLSTRVLFKNIERTTPDSSLFVPPPEARAFPNMKSMLISRVQQMMCP